MRINTRNICPYCSSTHYFRIPRKFYMRVSEFIKYYECDLCRKEFVVYEKDAEVYSEKLLDRAS